MTFDYTFFTIALGTSILGLVCGVLGCIAVLRRQSLVGDAMAHSCLPGLAIAFLITNTKEPLPLMLGAAISAAISMLVVAICRKFSRTAESSALATVLTTFFGFGVVMLSIVQQSPSANQAGLDKFLFGQAAGLIHQHIVVISLTGIIAITIFLLILKEFKLFAFDPVFARASNLQTERLDLILTGLIILAVVVGLNTVGVVLLSTMIIAPGVGARQWTHNLNKMLVIAGIAGFFSGLVGATISMVGELPTGPVVVIVSALWVGTSVLANSILRSRRKSKLELIR